MIDTPVPTGRYTDFAPVPMAICGARHISPGAKLCYGLLLRHAGQHATCWPGQATLARELGVSYAQAARYVHELTAAGLIQAVRRPGYSSSYQFTGQICGEGLRENDETNRAHICADGLSANEQTPPHICGGGLRIFAHRKNNIKETIKKTEKTIVEQRFGDWWELYPRHVARAAAERAYRREIGASPKKHDQLMAATREYLRVAWQAMLARGEGQYIPHGATYLSQGRWLEPPEAPARRRNGGVRPLRIEEMPDLLEELAR